MSRERCVNKGRIPCRHVPENVPIKAFQIGIGTARSEFYAAKAEFAKVDSMSFSLVADGKPRGGVIEYSHSPQNVHKVCDCSRRCGFSEISAASFPSYLYFS